MIADSDLRAFARLVEESAYTVILTGAGISTESGIPDFRSPGGLWEQFRIIEYGEYIRSEAARIEDWRRRFFMKDQIGSVEPNSGHTVIANWVHRGFCRSLITQNVDGLHSRSGVPDTQIIEIHGSATTASCLDCAAEYSIDQCRTKFEGDGRSPKCDLCKGIIKTDIVMFGEQMPVTKTERAYKEAENAELFIAIGTSLVVHPAAGLPLIAKRNHAKFAIVNREATELDRYADCVINAEIGAALTAIDELTVQSRN